MDQNENNTKSEFLEEYIKPKKTSSKKILSVVAFVSFFIILIFWINSMSKKIDSEQLKNTITLFNISSSWVENGTVDDGESKKIVLVPQIKFKIRNTGTTVLQYLKIVGVFKFLETDKFLGEGNKMVLKDPLPPGSESTEIVIKSDRGYRANSVNAFIDSNREWKSTYVNIFSKLSRSKHVFIKKFNISRKIKGMNLNVKIEEIAK